MCPTLLTLPPLRVCIYFPLSFHKPHFSQDSQLETKQATGSKIIPDRRFIEPRTDTHGRCVGHRIPCYSFPSKDIGKDRTDPTNLSQRSTKCWHQFLCLSPWSHWTDTLTGFILSHLYAAICYKPPMLLSALDDELDGLNFLTFWPVSFTVCGSKSDRWFSSISLLKGERA